MPRLDEISPRHLPDTPSNDTSFSFQIPSVLSSDDCLLDQDDTSFFRQDVIQRLSFAKSSGSSVMKTKEDVAGVAEKLEDEAGTKRQSSKRPRFQVEWAGKKRRKITSRNLLRIDARIEARKAGKQVPDFKSLHAAEEARLALRKESIVPTVPLPFRFTTDGRALERERFEGYLVEKERESKRVLEEKRREEEEREQRAIKEMRKKAVPRAHEVPVWYKHVPKRKPRVEPVQFPCLD